MLITKLFKHKCVNVGKKLQSKLNQCCAVIVQPHVVYCNVCKAVDGAHFVRNLISRLAYRDSISIMAGIAEKKFSAVPLPMVKKTCDHNSIKIS